MVERLLKMSLIYLSFIVSKCTFTMYHALNIDIVQRAMYLTWDR